ncbi:unnamed protein product [Cuscuta campestris]|uniref:Uncharacterized protein n=1 Tax=Cuscuta campestris TaxID=132261 RepID=A0A484LZ32_9ASTE|nr:unnamed protein product [Cuscuta campestris]
MEKAEDSPPTNEYSPANTIVVFEKPVPLLRGPIRTNPNSGEFALAFPDPHSWASAYKSCEHQITQQCEAGVRIGCSVSASMKCQPPWWRFAFGGGASKQEFSERQKCEEREMEACLREAKDRCCGYAKQKCSGAFLDAKIAVTGSKNPNINWKEASKLISCVNLADKKLGADLLRFQKPWAEFKTQFEVTCCRVLLISMAKE